MLCTAAAISAGHWAGHSAGTQPPAPSPALYGQLHSVPHSNTLVLHRTVGALLPPPTELRALQIWVCVSRFLLLFQSIMNIWGKRMSTRHALAAK